MPYISRNGTFQPLSLKNFYFRKEFAEPEK